MVTPTPISIVKTVKETLAVCRSFLDEVVIFIFVVVYIGVGYGKYKFNRHFSRLLLLLLLLNLLLLLMILLVLLFFLFFLRSILQDIPVLQRGKVTLALALLFVLC